MSVDNAKALLAKAKTDKELSGMLRAAGVAGFARAAEEAGHPCDLGHVRETLLASRELSAEELDAVAGGGSDNAGANTLAAAFVDLASHDEIERTLY